MFDFDTTLFLWINAGTASPAWVLGLARFASLELPQLLLAGTAGAFLVGDAHARRVVVRIVLAMMLAWIVARVVQHLWPMPRPFLIGLGMSWIPHGDSAGFPSTHASVVFAFAAAVAACTRHWLATAGAALAALLVAWSRISLGLHFPFDVVAGMLVGLVSAGLVGLLPGRLAPLRSAHE